LANRNLIPISICAHPVISPLKQPELLAGKLSRAGDSRFIYPLLFSCVATFVTAVLWLTDQRGLERQVCMRNEYTPARAAARLVA